MNILFNDAILELNRISFNNYFRKELESIPIIGEHSIYVSMLIGSALLFLFFVRFWKYWINILVGCLFLVVLLLSGSRGPTLALFIAFSFIIAIKELSYQAKLLTYRGFVVFAVMILFLTPIKSRIMEFVNTTHLYPVGNYFNSFNIRMGIYRCSFEVGEKTPWYGLGPGDVQNNLDLCYKNSYVTKAYSEGIFNTHSQYLFYWLSFGMVGLILILTSYVLFFRQAFLARNKLYIIFLIYILICCMFENILSRNTGIVLYTIFNTMFYCQSYLKKREKELID